MHAAVFLDRDGTLIADRDYLRDPAEVSFLPGAIEALKRLQDAGFKLFLVTNQSGVGRGYFTIEDVHRVHRHLEAELGKQAVHLQKIYVAPEAPEEPGRGRKPSPQFLLDARDEFGIDLPRSYMIGDKPIDVECGRNAGVRLSLLVRTGYGRESEGQLKESRGPVRVVEDLAEAADVILAADR
jgi:D-glycero-D-manno-heptose 1,7-bisphosphate phosphatase